MSRHVRAGIRQFFADAMEEITPGKVYGRVHPLTPDSMPGICVYWSAEGADSNTQNGATIRPLSLVVEVYVAGVDKDNEIDAQSVLIEKAMFDDESVGGLALGVLPAGAKIERGAVTGLQYTKCRMTFSVIYRTKDGDPENGI